ncbi:MAG: aminomethyl-transferring glycine dehydrogenase subunit GcvPB, partial [Geoalkalibacter sp.]
ELEPFLPVPVVDRDEKGYFLDWDRPHSIGRMKGFYGHFGVLVRAWTYIRSMGPEGLRRAAEMAVLNANYVRARLQDSYHLPYPGRSLHEVVFSDRNLGGGCKTLDLAKRLIDYGFHPPTIYFPLVVSGAIMIEPTESESQETLDEFCAAMEAIAREASEQPDLLKDAPRLTRLGRLDETRAARRPRLRWQP